MSRAWLVLPMPLAILAACASFSAGASKGPDTDDAGDDAGGVDGASDGPGNPAARVLCPTCGPPVTLATFSSVLPTNVAGRHYMLAVGDVRIAWIAFASSNT